MEPIDNQEPVDKAIEEQFWDDVISQTNMHSVDDEIREIVAKNGLGVAILVAWRHGLEIGNIPLHLDETSKQPDVQADEIVDDRYMYVHVPVRRIRGDKEALIQRGIMNRNADPVWFIYHEDGLVGTFSFANAPQRELEQKDVGYILDVLAQQGVLIEANINNRQIQFKSLASRQVIEESTERVYVRAEGSIDWEAVELPAKFDKPEVRQYVRDSIRKRTACNYCSVQALRPYEITIHSAHVHASAGARKDALATVRNYQLGFTYAPFGDPRTVCHFLAWDFPHINDLVMNMDPQAYSFSDLIKLVRVMNRDIAEYCNKKGISSFPHISGVCNHWAGNSIYHQHYQFFRMPKVPLLNAGSDPSFSAECKGIEVLKFAWPAPSYMIVSKSAADDENVMFVADRVAKEWESLNAEVDESYGNGIKVNEHTQNIFVTAQEDGLKAIFIPRHRGKLNTSERNGFRKTNAAVLEMMGYFLIDNKEHFDLLRSKGPSEWKALGDSWLSELAPDTGKIAKFEERLHTCLSDPFISYEKQLEEILAKTREDAQREIWALRHAIREDESLDDPQRQDLLQTIKDAWRKKYGGPL
jgi:hypothetical protein